MGGGPGGGGGAGKADRPEMPKPKPMSPTRTQVPKQQLLPRPNHPLLPKPKHPAGIQTRTYPYATIKAIIILKFKGLPLSKTWVWNTRSHTYAIMYMYNRTCVYMHTG